MSRFAAAIASAFRRYATWVVAISWKRFILLSVLLLIIAGIVSELPPFMVAAPKVSRQEGAAAGASLGEEIRREIIDEIRAERDPGQRAEPESGHLVRLGDYLPNLAFLLIIV